MDKTIILFIISALYSSTMIPRNAFACPPTNSIKQYQSPQAAMRFDRLSINYYTSDLSSIREEGRRSMSEANSTITFPIRVPGARISTWPLDNNNGFKKVMNSYIIEQCPPLYISTDWHGVLQCYLSANMIFVFLLVWILNPAEAFNDFPSLMSNNASLGMNFSCFSFEQQL